MSEESKIVKVCLKHGKLRRDECVKKTGNQLRCKACKSANNVRYSVKGSLRKKERNSIYSNGKSKVLDREMKRELYQKKVSGVVREYRWLISAEIKTDE